MQLMHKPNKLLESDVTEELTWDPQLDESRITVSADDGQVTLSGSVPTFYEVGAGQRRRNARRRGQGPRQPTARRSGR